MRVYHFVCSAAEGFRLSGHFKGNNKRPMPESLSFELHLITQVIGKVVQRSPDMSGHYQRGSVET